ncbi:hypothetical protein [Erysipelothrix piscisicarius]|nr:hypothetical protein [Erysipelothrix piscisicarius]
MIDQHRNGKIAHEGNIDDIEVLETFDRMMIDIPMRFSLHKHNVSY